MSDEDFLRSMESLGVEPIDGGTSSGKRDADPRPGESETSKRSSERRRRRASRRGEAEPGGAISSEDRELFHRAIAQLDDPPDKDLTGPSRGVEKVRLSRRSAVPVGRRLDLHGATADEARRRLESFLEESLATGARTVLVITGKGRNSPGRRGILRAVVETWLRRHGEGRVERYAEAPPALGGAGAFVLWLRRLLR